MEKEPDAPRENASEPATMVGPAGMRETLASVPVLARIGWFALGALLATMVTLLALHRPWGRRHGDAGSALPFEGFPFADNAGVCQEYVALATLRTSHADAQGIATRLAPSLPTPMRAENLRVVRAFAPGDYWTVAVDAQSGSGDIEQAGRVAVAMNAIAGTGIHFEPVFYSSRRLYDTARVLCMPRQGDTNAH